MILKKYIFQKIILERRILSKKSDSKKDYMFGMPKHNCLIENPKAHATCPMCDALIIEKGDFWICEKNCGFEMTNVFEGKKIDISMLTFIQNIKGYDNLIDSTKRECRCISKTRKELYGNKK